jgi:alkylation response protein AidB-like acyl-CoA dehydrogenase
VDFAFTPEQELLRETVRDLLSEIAPLTYVRTMLDDAAGIGESEWRRIADLGWLGLVFPEEHGGSGLSLVELAIVLEEMGRALFPGPFLSTIVGGLVLVAGGSDVQRRRWLPGICDGSVRATLALAEASGSWDPAAMTARAEPRADGLALSGTKLFVADAHLADVLLCALRRPDGALILVAVERGTPGMSLAPLASMDQTRKIFAVTFDGVAVREEQILPCDATAVLERVLDQARVALAAEMSGGAGRVLEMTVEYAKIRHQFGRPIGSFQAIQHRCADMLVEVEKARMAATYAAWATAADAADAALAAADAMALAGDAYRTVTTQAIQVHGGIGFTWEHDLHLYFKRAQSSAVTFGDASWCRELAARRR